MTEVSPKVLVSNRVENDKWKWLLTWTNMSFHGFCAINTANLLCMHIQSTSSLMCTLRSGFSTAN